MRLIPLLQRTSAVLGLILFGGEASGAHDYSDDDTETTAESVGMPHLDEKLMEIQWS